MKVVKLKPNKGSHPELVSGSVSDSKQTPTHRDDWSYQGKRPDQVESSYKIFAFCLLAFLILALFILIMKYIFN